MPINHSRETSRQPRRSLGYYIKQGGLTVLFGSVLIIPRIRRLRRRVWAWNCVRAAASACGVWLLWRFARSGMGAPTLFLGLLLLAFGLLVRARPAVKSVDALARELDALIVLNGGRFFLSPDSVPVPGARIFVHPDRIIVFGARDQRLLEVPLAKVQSLAARPVTNRIGKGPKLWEVEIRWTAEGPCMSTFQYDGAFAEHLARVAEATLRSQWIKDLPVIQ